MEDRLTIWRPMFPCQTAPGPSPAGIGGRVRAVKSRHYINIRYKEHNDR